MFFFLPCFFFFGISKFSARASIKQIKKCAYPKPLVLSYHKKKITPAKAVITKPTLRLLKTPPSHQNIYLKTLFLTAGESVKGHLSW